MGLRILRGTIAALALTAAVTACTDDGASTAPATTAGEAVTTTAGPSGSGTEGVGGPSAGGPAGAPAEYAEHGEGWVLPGRDYDNSRHTTDSAISAENVGELEVAWEAPVQGQLSTVPLIVGDTVYVQDSRGSVYAFDLATGDERWSSEPNGFSIGPFGVAVADGRVFGMYGSTGVVALDAETGEELWVSEITATPTTGIDIQPTVYGGKVFVSTVPVSIGGIYTGGDRGVIHALDAGTGEVVWTFDTVDSEDLWGNPGVNSGGGAWYPPSIDKERGLVYWGVANPAPFPGTPEFPNASSRPGPNLYTNSVVALDVETGELAWYHQVIPHDLFDRDLVHTMIARPDGLEIVVTTGKGATVVGIDIESGEPLWETSVGLHLNDDLTELDGPTEVAPGTFGGVITPPATADGVVYVATVNSPVELRPDETAYFGATMGQAPGEVVAIDAVSGEVLWSVEAPGDPLGGVAVVNDLVLTATFQGAIVALDRDTGEVVWEAQAPGGLNGWMSVAGDTVVVPVGMASPPRLVAYRLGG